MSVGGGADASTVRLPHPQRVSLYLPLSLALSISFSTTFVRRHLLCIQFVNVFVSASASASVYFLFGYGPFGARWGTETNCTHTISVIKRSFRQTQASWDGERLLLWIYNLKYQQTQQIMPRHKDYLLFLFKFGKEVKLETFIAFKVN